MTAATIPAAGKTPRTDGTGLVELDPFLADFAAPLRDRHRRFKDAERRYLLAAPDHAGPISLGHHYFGFNRGSHEGRSGVWYREWAPAAHGLFLVGDFNGWDRRSHPLWRGDYGVWSLFLPDAEFAGRLTHGSRVKVHVTSAKGAMDRIPAYIRRTVQDPASRGFDGIFWEPPVPFAWTADRPRLKGAPRIYECHPGMATEQYRVGTWAEFAKDVLPRVADLGYNTLQVMAVAEHPYYGSFGYHVSGLYVPASRFGTPDDLKGLVDAAHARGIIVLMDLVQSHAVKNQFEGLAGFDGSDDQYFHPGARGRHPAWDSLLFDYSKREVVRFLLSNVRYWLEEYRFDGFRFDGVTSMLYHHHGLGRDFNGYGDYFGPETDVDAVTYLQLANRVAHDVAPGVLTVAEEVSGMPGLARPAEDGGLGFDYRLSMGLPDFWIKLLKERRDEDWPMGDLYHCLLNRRSWQGEPHIAYAESHDQAMVGDKTIAFRLMDAAMYHGMHVAGRDVVVDRGVALHKMIRLVSFLLGGEGWLNFMGNEFGHPEWIDFPREGNGYGYHYARRQWSLVDNRELRYRQLNEFDRAMMKLDADFNVLSDARTEQMYLHEEHKLLAARRGTVVAAFNFHPVRSVADLRIGVPDACDWKMVLDTDAAEFGGHARVKPGQVFPAEAEPCYGKARSIRLYLPARTAIVLAGVPPSKG